MLSAWAMIINNCFQVLVFVKSQNGLDIWETFLCSSTVYFYRNLKKKNPEVLPTDWLGKSLPCKGSEAARC